MRRALLAMCIVGALSCSREQFDPYAQEVAAREAFAKRAIEESDAGRAWGISSTAEYQFEEGFSIILYEPEKDGPSFHEHAFRWMGQTAHVRLKTHGARPMKLVMVGWANEGVIQSKPVISVFVDGVHITTTPPIEHGHYWVETIVPDWALRRPWVDLVIRTSAVAFHWSDPPELKVLNMYRFAWTEAN